jgi:hypothetical protein
MPHRTLQIHLTDGADDKPRQMPRRQPLAHVGRHHKRLLAITHDKALSHREMVLNPPDGTPDIRDSHTRMRERDVPVSPRKPRPLRQIARQAARDRSGCRGQRWAAERRKPPRVLPLTLISTPLPAC